MSINALTIGVVIILIGLYGVITKQNLIKMVMALYVMSSGIVLFFVGLGYVSGGEAAILENGSKIFVDPLPQAVMLTTIVIGLLLTSLGLALSVKIYDIYKTLNASELISKK